MQVQTLYDFSKEASPEGWVVINDGVMGGLSRSTLTVNAEGHGVFSGKVSLENNGGFASIRLAPGMVSLKNSIFLVLHVKGDGRRYQVRLRERKGDYYAYVHYFETSGGWEKITLPLSEFYATFRGRKLNLPDFKGDSLEEVGILIGNDQEEEFELRIDSILLE